MKRMLVLPVFALLAFTASAETASAQMFEKSDFKIFIGGGVRSAPDYLGSDNYEISFKPTFDLTWQDSLFINSENGAGLYFINTPPNTRLGMSVMLDHGRDESANARLTGMGDIDQAAQFKLFYDYSWNPVTVGASLRQSFTNDRGDLQASAYLRYKQELMPKLSMSVTPSLTWASEEYMETFFGVSAAQAAASGHPAFAAESGLRDTSLSAQLDYALTSKMSVTTRASWMRLMGDAADSPLTMDKNQFSFVLGAGYRFQ